MKKIFKLFTVLTAFMVALFVASCQGTTNNTTTTTTTVAQTTTTSTTTSVVKHSITLENTITDVSVSTSVVKNVDGAPQKVAIEYGKEYEAGLNVYIAISNNSDKKIEVVVYLADRASKTETVASKTNKSISGVELTANLKIVVRESVAQTAKLTINEDLSKNSQTAVNKVHAYDPDDADLRDYSNNEEIALGKKMKIYEFNYASPVHFVVTHNGTTVVDKYYSTITDMQKGHDEFFDLVIEGDVVITVTNVDKVPGQDLTLHVEGDETIGWVYIGYTDIHDGAALEAGEQTFTVYPQDTTKNLKVVIKVGTEEVVNETISGDKDYDINVTADVYFTFTVSDEEVVKEKYSVTITNSLNDTKVTANIRYLDSAMTPVDIVSGNKYDEGTKLFVQIINGADYKVKVTCKKGTTVVDSAEIDAKPADDDASYGGLMGVALTGDFVIEIAKIEEAKSYTVTVTNGLNDTNVTMNVVTLDANNTPTPIVSGNTYAENTLLFVQVSNAADYKVKVTCKKGTTVVDSAEIDAKPADEDSSAGGLMGVALTGDFVIEITKVEENGTQTNTPASYNVAVNNETGYMIQCFYGESMTDLEDGNVIEAGTYDFTIGGFYPDEALVIELYVGETLIGSVEVSEYGEESQDFANVTVNGNVTVSVRTK